MTTNLNIEHEVEFVEFNIMGVDCYAEINFRVFIDTNKYVIDNIDIYTIYNYFERYGYKGFRATGALFDSLCKYFDKVISEYTR